MRPSLDHLGAIAGFACAIHCVAVGVAISFLSAVGLGFLASREAEIAFLSTAAVIGLAAAYSGFKRHRSFLPTTLFFIGAGVLAYSFNQMCSSGHPHICPQTHLTSALGGVCLIAFHIVNHQMAKSCQCSACKPPSSGEISSATQAPSA